MDELAELIVSSHARWVPRVADPTLDQLDGFVADYEAARGVPFDPDERQVLSAGQRWVASYGARCQHSDDLLGFPDVDHSRGWPRLLGELLGR